MRLDKFICSAVDISRKQIKDELKKGRVTVNGEVIKSGDFQVEDKDLVMYDNLPVRIRKERVYMLNKPAGYVSATNDNTAPTIISLFIKEDNYNDLFPVGRLDKDTLGLIFVTDMGDLCHRLTAPRYEVGKTYRVECSLPVSIQMCDMLQKGVDIGDERPTKPAVCEIVDKNTVLLTITEGRFHEVKRMLRAVGNEVIGLKRVSFGPIRLDSKLAEGEYRSLTDLEIDSLKKMVGL